MCVLDWALMWLILWTLWGCNLWAPLCCRSALWLVSTPLPSGSQLDNLHMRRTPVMNGCIPPKSRLFRSRTRTNQRRRCASVGRHVSCRRVGIGMLPTNNRNNWAVGNWTLGSRNPVFLNIFSATYRAARWAARPPRVDRRTSPAAGLPPTGLWFYIGAYERERGGMKGGCDK